MLKQWQPPSFTKITTWNLPNDELKHFLCVALPLSSIDFVYPVNEAKRKWIERRRALSWCGIMCFSKATSNASPFAGVKIYRWQHFRWMYVKSFIHHQTETVFITKNKVNLSKLLSTVSKEQKQPRKINMDLHRTGFSSNWVDVIG